MIDLPNFSIPLPPLLFSFLSLHTHTSHFIPVFLFLFLFLFLRLDYYFLGFPFSYLLRPPSVLVFLSHFSSFSISFPFSVFGYFLSASSLLSLFFSLLGRFSSSFYLSPPVHFPFLSFLSPDLYLSLSLSLFFLTLTSPHIRQAVVLPLISFMSNQTSAVSLSPYLSTPVFFLPLTSCQSLSLPPPLISLTSANSPLSSPLAALTFPYTFPSHHLYSVSSFVFPSFSTFRLCPTLPLTHSLCFSFPSPQ